MGAGVETDSLFLVHRLRRANAEVIRND
jgi:hypothetical protein